jgi:hypothetical protein
MLGSEYTFPETESGSVKVGAIVPIGIMVDSVRAIVDLLFPNL